MTKEQEMFLTFMLERTMEGLDDRMKASLETSFNLQETQPFTKESFEKLRVELLSLIKPEHIEEVSQIMNHFASQAVV